jgi:hypothetical protein
LRRSAFIICRLLGNATTSMSRFDGIGPPGRRPSNPKCKRGSTRVIVMRSHRPCTDAPSLTVRVTCQWGRRPSNPKCKRGSTRVIVTRSHRPCTDAASLTGRVTCHRVACAAPLLSFADHLVLGSDLGNTWIFSRLTYTERPRWNFTNRSKVPTHPNS